MKFFPFKVLWWRKPQAEAQTPVQQPGAVSDPQPSEKPQPVPRAFDAGTEETAEPRPVSGTQFHSVGFCQPPGGPYAQATHCHERDLEPALVQDLEHRGPACFMVVAADYKEVIVQTREGVCRLNRSELSEVSLHPVLPAKGGGMILLFFEMYRTGLLESYSFLMCGSYSEAHQQWCEHKGRQVASLLKVPFKVTPPSHDC